MVVSFLVDEVVGGFFISVPPGHVACVYDRGRGVLSRVWGPGLHFKIPFWQMAKLFNAQLLEYSIRENFKFEHNSEALGDLPILTNTRDGHDIAVEGSILFRIDKKNAPELWENLGEHVVSKVVRPAARSIVASVFADIDLEQVKHHRKRVEELVQHGLQEYFADKGLNCEGFLLSSIKSVKSGHVGKQIIAGVQQAMKAKLNGPEKSTGPTVAKQVSSEPIGEIKISS